MERGQLQDIKRLRFAINEDIPYQETLLSGQPFISNDVANDPRLEKFRSFNPQATTTALLEAPIIVNGETIGWIGADAVDTHREFRQREIDLARAMADQIAIAIQNRRLLEQTEYQASQLKAVATVGEAVTGLMDLDEVLKATVDLIRDQFGYYHVSIFLVDEDREWAVVRASTGEVGKIMVQRPHRLGVGSNSIVGFVTANASPRIALDVGQDKVHFNNPLLPKTRSEMALPLISRGIVIGALDVQSEEPNAFTQDDVETLQIMAAQLVTAIENARLFEQTQRRLIEQAMLYRIGTKIGGTLNLQETTNILTAETADALDVAECALTLHEEGGVAYIISDHIKEYSSFRNDQGQRFNVQEFAAWFHILETKQEFVVHIDDSDGRGWEFEYLKYHRGTALAIVPILLRNDVIGLLEVYDDKPGRRFKQEDISLLDSIALQAANAIENARLFETAHESQTFMKAIIDQIPDPIFIKDREHRWVVVNNSFSKDILGQPEENILGYSDYDFLPEEEADWFWEQDNKMFDTGQTQETEEPITAGDGSSKILYTRKIPLTLNPNESKPEYLIGIINDITEQKQHELERERLIAQTQKTLERTQTLYRISDTLAAAAEPGQQQAIFETVLGEYLKLLGSQQGSLTLFDKTTKL
jgi:PAS domain S-box-containing protein